ncbi:hypothetical protein E2562_003877 [Oryza meyeriana var. granulata]|uniref:Uncharacterized protein n=1 Tax=Oryza meyeriana var. granulata TaxID=110450 RepID=A0A6G1CYT6_9ORYZ|nr:hypothetical protein E2562_003877 [Oryza meyeriana var. granulata]
MEVGVPVKEDAGGKRAAPSGAAAPCRFATGAALPTPFRCKGAAVAFSSDAAAAAFRSRTGAASFHSQADPAPFHSRAAVPFRSRAAATSSRPHVAAASSSSRRIVPGWMGCRIGLGLGIWGKQIYGGKWRRCMEFYRHVPARTRQNSGTPRHTRSLGAVVSGKWLYNGARAGDIIREHEPLPSSHEVTTRSSPLIK